MPKSIVLEKSNESKKIYNDMLKQFPKNELKTLEHFCTLLKKPQYNLYIAKEEEPVGYVIVAMTENSMWLDYLAIFEKFHSQGFGGTIIKNFSKNFPNMKGCFLEVEQIDEFKPNTIRRVKFYEELGAIKLKRRYFYPNKDGELEMDIYFLPYEKGFYPDKNFVNKAIKQTFALLHNELPHMKSTLAKNLN